jgi:hypothetical protein
MVEAFNHEDYLILNSGANTFPALYELHKFTRFLWTFNAAHEIPFRLFICPLLHRLPIAFHDYKPTGG